MGAKMIVLRYPAPVHVDHAGALFLGPNTILPVIFVGKATAGPADYRRLDFSQRLHQVAADPPQVGNRRLWAYIEAVIDAAPQVLGKMPL